VHACVRDDLKLIGRGCKQKHLFDPEVIANGLHDLIEVLNAESREGFERRRSQTRRFARL